MPYISKDLRATPDLVVETVKKGGIVEALVILSDYVETLPIEQVDGVISYVFTKLLKDVDLSYSIAGVDLFINGVIQGVYLEDKSYFKLNRLLGLLYCMKKLYADLGWKTEGYVGKLLEVYSTYHLLPYEYKKREENGDVDE